MSDDDEPLLHLESVSQGWIGAFGVPPSMKPSTANAQAAAVARPLGAQPVPPAAMAAAIKLRDSIRVRPVKRHVRIETAVDGTGEFTYTLVCSVDPSTGVAVLLSEIDGFPVRIEPWPH